MTLVVVTGVPGAGKSTLAAALADRLGSTLVSLDAIKEELAAEGPDTPRHWLRPDAEELMVKRLAAVSGEAVVDIWVAPRRDVERVRELLTPWWHDAVEVRCQVPTEVAVARYSARVRPWPHLPPDGETLERIRDAADRPESLGAPRMIVVDTTQPVAAGDLASVVRRDPGARRTVRRVPPHPGW